MQTIAIISQKGGAGKTTLALNLAAEAQRCGKVTLVIDTDPQASAFTWGDWRKGEPPDVIDCPPALLTSKHSAAEERGADLIVIDTPPHAEAAAVAAARVADLILIPCRPSALDLHAVKLTIDLAAQIKTPAFAVFSGGSPNAPRLHEEAETIIHSYGLKVAPQIIAERADFRAGMGAGMTAFEVDPNGKAAAEIIALWQWATLEAERNK